MIKTDVFPNPFILNNIPITTHYDGSYFSWSKKILLNMFFSTEVGVDIFSLWIEDKNSSLFIHHFNYSIRALPGLENSYKHLVGAVFFILGDYYKIQSDPHNAEMCVVCCLVILQG